MASSSVMADVVRRLKHIRPKSVLVFTSAGEEKTIPVPPNRRKWETVRTLLNKLEWIRLHLLDDKNGISDIIENPDYETEDLEEIDQVLDRTTGQVAQMTKIVLASVHTLSRESREQNAQQHAALLKLVEILTQRNSQLERGYAANLSWVQKFARKAVGGEEVGDASGEAIVEMIRMLRGKPLPGDPDFEAEDATTGNGVPE